jgi:hypothetical protein
MGLVNRDGLIKCGFISLSGADKKEMIKGGGYPQGQVRTIKGLP